MLKRAAAINKLLKGVKERVSLQSPFRSIILNRLEISQKP